MVISTTAFPLQDTLLTLLFLSHTLWIPHEGASVHNSRPQTTRSHQMNTLPPKHFFQRTESFTLIGIDTSLWEQHKWFGFSLFCIWIFGVFFKTGFLNSWFFFSYLPSTQKTNMNHWVGVLVFLSCSSLCQLSNDKVVSLILSILIKTFHGNLKWVIWKELCLIIKYKNIIRSLFTS